MLRLECSFAILVRPLGIGLNAAVAQIGMRLAPLIAERGETLRREGVIYRLHEMAVPQGNERSDAHIVRLGRWEQ